MKLIKLGLISVFFLSLLLYLMSLLIPSRVRISRAVNIDASAETIQQRLTDMSHWDQWNELISEKTTVALVSVLPDTVVTSWKNRSTIVQGVFTIEHSAGVSVLQWYFDFHLRWYPWEKFGSIIFDKQIGPGMENSLNNLKKRIENSP